MKNRPKDINLNIGVGKNKGFSNLYVMGVMSTLQKKFSKNQSKTINIKMDTMYNVCQKYIKNDKDIHFCKIDVEGEEKNVLLGYDFNRCRPQIFMIESTIPATYIPSHSEWEYILLKNNYIFVYKYKINRFYIDNTFPNLKKRFNNIDNYIKLYEINKAYPQLIKLINK